MSLRDIERESIRRFVQQAASEGYLSGRVLDYGCGLSPYQDIIQSAGAIYEGFDHANHPGNVGGVTCGEDLFWDSNAWDAILCTQVLQFIPLYPEEDGLDALLITFHQRLFKGGHLVLTYTTNWAEVEREDLHRHTRAGMERLLTEVGFKIIQHEAREIIAVTLDGENLYAGYGVVARA